ncbi:hypothetical protein D3C81_2033710 [compost metagenome]
MSVIRTVDNFAGKMGHPVGMVQLNFVAEAWRFMMLCHPGAQHSAVKIGTDQQLNGTRIAVRRGRFHHHCNRGVVFAGNVDFMVAFP